jgi:hypothetical protein
MAPQMSGTVTERPLKDGRAEVTVLLNPENANVWVFELDLSVDLRDQVANKPALFGHRTYDVVYNAMAQAPGDSFLHVVFINDAPGAQLPDLIQLVNVPDTLPGRGPEFLAFRRTSSGPSTP